MASKKFQREEKIYLPPGYVIASICVVLVTMVVVAVVISILKILLFS